MQSWLNLEEYGEGIGSAGSVLRTNAASAGLHAPVPTCPGWNVLDLVAHQGMVHRWATAVVRGQHDPRTDRWDEAAIEGEGRAHPDVLGWFDDGLVDLLDALGGAPDDLDVFFFLRQAASPRTGWARRQCHETSIHAVDALAARLGRVPEAAQVWVRPRHAADGVDELVTGFVPRSRSPLRRDEPATLALVASDTGDRWTVRVSADPPHATRGGAPVTADATIAGTALQLYLGLWNRGDELEVTGDRQLLRLWHDAMRVSW